MIDVLHVITDLDSGGAERQLALLCQESDPAQIRHKVISLTGPGIWGERLAQSGIEIRSLGLARGSMRPFAVLKLAALIRDSRPAILQSWLYHADLIALLASPFARPFAGGPKLIWTIRCSDMRLERYSRLTRMVQRVLAFFSRCPAIIVANSETGQKAHAAIGYRPKAWQVIPNGVDTDLFRADESARQSVRSELGLDPNAILVGNFSRHDPMKDHPSSFAAFARGAQDAWLILAGTDTGPENIKLTQEIAESGIDPSRVKRLGPRQDIPRLTAALDVALSSSAFGEGFSNVLAEAMACGIPCVTTQSGDAEFLTDGMAPLARPGDVETLAAGLARMIHLSPSERTELSARLRQRAQEFSIGRMVAAYGDLYRSLLKSPA